MTKNKHPIGWSIAVFLLAIIIAIVGLVGKQGDWTMLLLAIFLINAASFLKLH